MEAADSAEEERNLFDYYYADVSRQAELSKRGSTGNVLRGQAAFFTLVTKLDIPILDKWSNQLGGQDSLSVGQGASYNVTRGRSALDERVSRTTFYKRDKEGRLEDSVGKRQYVTKKIVPDGSAGVTDAQRLAAITNEVRILGQKSLRKSEHLVSLICVAWDELPSSDGRHWPRLLLEPADFGNLGTFLTKSDRTFLWDVKARLIEDVVAGLSSLHSHGVAHCDLKPENVLVFRRADSRDIFSTSEFVAKICDFGFSVVITDYTVDAVFSERLGTEPWSSPELTFATDIPVKNLIMSDIYSLGLLIATVFMNGEDPFNGRTAEQIRELKKWDEKNPLRLSTSLLRPLFLKSGSNRDQKLKLSLLLARCLAYYPKGRPAASTLRGALVPAYLPKSSKTGSEATSSGHGQEKGQQPKQAPSATSFSLASNGREALDALRESLRVSLKRLVELSSVNSKPALTWLFRTEADSWGLVQSQPGRYADVKAIESEHIWPLTPVNPPIEGGYSYWGYVSDDLEDLPDFEDSITLNPTLISPNMATEIVQDLVRQIENPRDFHPHRVAEIKYQLSVAYFEGIGVPKDPEKGLDYLEDAALCGSSKALVASYSIFASMRRPLSPQLTAAVRSCIAQQAKDELIFACAKTFSGRIWASDSLLALERWRSNAHDDYTEYIKSQEWRWVRYTVFLGCLMIEKSGVKKKGVEADKVARYEDFKALPGYEKMGVDFDPSLKTEFVKAIKDSKCVETTNGHLTLLQQAAATGDLELVKTLVSEAGVNVDSCGATPGITPLWLSCAHGHIDVLKFLVAHGADVHCRHGLWETTILHFLHQFTFFKDVFFVFETALKAGISSNANDLVGNTPLMATFKGFDFSEDSFLESYASKILMAGGGDVLVRRADDWNLLSLAVRALDVRMLKRLLQQLDSSKQSGPLPPRAYSLTAGEAKAKAFITLLGQTWFYRRLIAGPAVPHKLAAIADLLLDDDMLAAYMLSDRVVGNNPLLSACGIDDGDVAIAVLGSANCPPIDGIGPGPDSLRPLSAAVERGNLPLAMKLLADGADPLLTSPEGETIFHRAAQFAPAVLIQLLDHIESGRIVLPVGHDAHTVLAMKTPRGFDAFAFAVVEGSPTHLYVAETVRKKYGLDHEAYDIDGKGTLLAWMVDSCINQNIFTLEPLEYVLGLGSTRDFVADSRGSSLLHKAVGVGFHVDLSSNPTGYAALRLLLRKFPGRRSIEAPDASGYNVIHEAVGHANIHALEIIEDDLKGRGEEFDPNARRNGLPPALSLLDHDTTAKAPSETGDSGHENAIVNRNKAKTYEFLRNRGAYLNEEVEPGITVCIAHGRQDDLPIEILIQFLQRLETEHKLEWRLDQDEVPLEAQETKHAFWIVELRWCHDSFVTRATAVLADDVDRHIYRMMRHHYHGTLKGAFYAWTQTKHNERVNGHAVEWTRQGRCWTETLVEQLVAQFKTTWKTTIPHAKDIRRQARYAHSSLQLPSNWNSPLQRNHVTLYNYSSAEEVLRDINETSPTPAGYKRFVTRNATKDFQTMVCWEAVLMPNQ